MVTESMTTLYRCLRRIPTVCFHKPLSPLGFTPHQLDVALATNVPSRGIGVIGRRRATRYGVRRGAGKGAGRVRGPGLRAVRIEQLFERPSIGSDMRVRGS